MVKVPLKKFYFFQFYNNGITSASNGKKKNKHI